MNRLVKVGVTTLGCTILDVRACAADDTPTDANIVTALDISESMDVEDMRIAIEGMARAIRAPEILQAIKSGRHGRIGFAVFAWHHGMYPEVVSWTLIASANETSSVSRQIEARLKVDVEAEALNQPKYDHVGRLTDLSEAIERAATLLRTAPYSTDRLVVNIIGNGEDNNGEGPQRARDRVIAEGGTINGVVLGGDPAVLDHYRRQVIGGPGAFLLFADDGDTVAELLARKSRYDIVCAPPLRQAEVGDDHAKAGMRMRCGTSAAIAAAASARPNELDHSQP
jgi:Protein of unknown function (DUF1194)